MKRKKPFVIVLICAVIAVIFIFIDLLGWIETSEFKAVDARFRGAYTVRKKWESIHVSDAVVLVGIDNKSVDPSVSRNSDRWGSGGWRTREHFVNALVPLALDYQPRVVAYDILFVPDRIANRDSASHNRLAGKAIDDFFIKYLLSQPIDLKDATPFQNNILGEEHFPRLAMLDLFAANSETEFGNQLFRINKERKKDSTIPEFISAYSLSSTKIEFGAKAWSSEIEEDQDKIIYLKKNILPSQCIENPEKHDIPADNAELPFTELSSYTHLGCISVPRDVDGIIRRIPLIYSFIDPISEKHERLFLPSFALQSCMLYLGIPLNHQKTSDPDPTRGVRVVFGKEIHLWTPSHNIHIPIDQQGRLFLNFDCKFGDFGNVPYVSLLDNAQIFRAKKNGEKFESDKEKKDLQRACQVKDALHGKIMFVGLTFTGASDVGPCAIDSTVPYVFIHATTVDNILRGRFMRPSTFGWNAVLLFSLLSIVAMLNFFSSRFGAAIGGVALLLGYLIANFLLFYFNVVILPVVVPSLAILTAFTGSFFYRYLVEQKGREEIRKQFSTMVSASVLRYMEEHPESFSRHEKREATMFFSDVAKFTTISEKLAPEKLSKILNDYLTPMTNLILERDGYVNKYAGDGIMAVWGVPYPTVDHAVQACWSALEQQDKVRELIPFFKKEYDVKLHVRMGLNSGTVSAGKMGTTERSEYTVMGDAVNLAARLEPANKDYGSLILIGQKTYEFAKDQIVTRYLDRIVVQGKSEPISIYELVGKKGAVPDSQLELIRLFEEGLSLYWNKDWHKAIEAFQSVLQQDPEDVAAKVFIERTKDFQLQPPPEGWKGEYVRESKN